MAQTTGGVTRQPGDGARRRSWLRLPEHRSRLTALDRLIRAGVVAWVVVGIALAGWVLLQALERASVLFPPLVLAVALVYLLNPLVSALERRGVPRAAGAGLVYLLLLAGVGFALWRLVPLLADEITRAVEGFPGWVQTMERRLDAIAVRWGQHVDLDLVGVRVQEYVGDPANRQSLLNYATGLRAVTSSLAHLLVVGVSGLIVAFYLLVDLPRLRRGVLAMLPPGRRGELQELGGRVGRAVGGFFRGQLVVALFVGVASAGGLALVGLPFWLLVGVVAGLFNLVPLVGPWVAGLVAVVVALVNADPRKALWAALVLLVVQQIDNHLVSPNVMSRAVQLHPVVVILAVLLGAATHGLLGMLVAVPLAAAAKICFVHLWTSNVSYGQDLVTPEPATQTPTPRPTP